MKNVLDLTSDLYNSNAENSECLARFSKQVLNALTIDVNA